MKKYLLILIISLFSVGTYVNGSCFEYGLRVQDNYDGTCSCIKGYHFENKYGFSTTCVKDPTCSDLYGFGAKDNFDGTCSCIYGYIRGIDVLGNKACIDADSVCRDQMGFGAESAENGYCKCKQGYIMDSNSFGKECVKGELFCNSKYGLYSSYNYLQDGCECDAGYTTDENGQCVKKQNNVYALLFELKTQTREAKISFDTDGDGRYNDTFFYVKYSVGCHNFDIDNYLSKLLVVNLGTDFNLDKGDKLVMTNQSYDCDITYREKVDEEFSIFSCEELFGPHFEERSDGKCYCEEGYELEDEECVEKEDYIPSINYNNGNNNSTIELQNGISRMYINGLTRYNTISDFLSYDYLTREQASKFFVEFAQKIKRMDGDTNEKANFSDLGQADYTLQSYILLSYQLGLFRGVNGKFLPFNNLTKAQALAVLIRLKNGLQDESGSFRYQKYYEIASTYGLLKDMDFSFETMDDTFITRGEMATLLYRLSMIN